MIEEYLKKLETIISPQTYDLNNYKDKILKSHIDFPDKDFVQGLDDMNEQESRSGMNIIKDMERKEQFNKTSNEKGMSSSKNMNLRSETDIRSGNTTIIDSDKLRQKVHNLNVKNMAYRQQIDNLNRKIEDQSRQIDSQRRTIDESKVTIENSSKYLLKLESYLVEAGKNKARERFTLNLLGVNFGFAKECKDQANKASFSVERVDMREMIVALTNENKKLKEFQNRIIDLSTTYDEVNQNMMESLKEAQDNLSSFFQNHQDEKIDHNTAFYLNEINQNVLKLTFCVEETLISKQAEYKLILDTKDREMDFLRKEIVDLNENLENAKKDRMKDQKNMIEVECQNYHLHQEIEELNKTINENYTKLKLLDTENVSSKIEVILFYFFINYLQIFKKNFRKELNLAKIQQELYWKN